MEALWDAEYHRLPESAARIYRLLADHPGPDSTVESAAAMAGVGRAAADEDLRELVRIGLLGEGRDGRFQLPDPLRRHAQRFARTGPDATDHAAAQLRIARWFRRQAERADRAAEGDRLRIAEPLSAQEAPGPELAFAGARQAISWLESERFALFDLVHRSAAAGWDELAWATAEPLDALFESHGHFVRSVEVLTTAVAAADRSGPPAAGAWMRCLLARPLWELARFAEAEGELAAAIPAATAARDPRLLAAVWQRHGRLNLAKGELAEAQADFERSKSVGEPIPHPRAVIRRLYLLAELETLQRRPWRALALLGEAAVLAEGGDGRAPDERMRGRIAQAAGAAHLALGEPRAAEEPLRRALAVAERRGWSLDEAQARDGLAAVVADPVEAELHRRRAAEIRAAACGSRVQPAGCTADPGADEGSARS